MTHYKKKTKYRRECKHCEKWFDSETKWRDVCDKCKEKNYKRLGQNARKKLK